MPASTGDDMDRLPVITLPRSLQEAPQSRYNRDALVRNASLIFEEFDINDLHKQDLLGRTGNPFSTTGDPPRYFV